MSHIRKFIIVDDDPWTNKITQINIRRAVGTTDTITFTMAEEALRYIQNEYDKNKVPSILFLDINMPVMNGWDFLEHYKLLSDEIKQQIDIYVLSSSINSQDVEKAKANKYVKDFISKPLDKNTIIRLAGE